VTRSFLDLRLLPALPVAWLPPWQRHSPQVSWQPLQISVFLQIEAARPISVLPITSKNCSDIMSTHNQIRLDILKNWLDTNYFIKSSKTMLFIEMCICIHNVATCTCTYTNDQAMNVSQSSRLKWYGSLVPVSSNCEVEGFGGARVSLTCLLCLSLHQS